MRSPDAVVISPSPASAQSSPVEVVPPSLFVFGCSTEEDGLAAPPAVARVSRSVLLPQPAASGAAATHAATANPRCCRFIAMFAVRGARRSSLLFYGSSDIRVGGRIEIQSATSEEDGGSEVGEAAIAKGSFLEQTDHGVDGFAGRVGDAVLEVGQDVG